MKKVLITGGSGLLGQFLNLTISNQCKLHTTFKNNPGNCKDFPFSVVDILNEDELKELFENVKPDIVIHSAAITNPVQKENQTSKEYFDTNVNATKNIAILCEKYESKMIYISTDLVYAGYRGSFLKEDAKLIPASLYAETKLVGEMKVKESTDNYLILRTALLYGFGLNHSKCHFQNMYVDLKNRKPVKLFTDQLRTPISLTDASLIIAQLVKMDLINETINLGGTERVSRFEIGQMLCDLAGLDKNLLQKIMMDEIPNFPKVEDVSLNIDKLISLNLKPRSIEENINEIITK
ncbi:MAG: SDR family oxidoreductase [Ignavibacteriota bacterium]|jgi:dTDP-4-dehydrorhamnose reductase|nr:MAG: SDR family oxidoreductase [Chlorobiota bacterium]MBE7476484.1 SDR family oxidoreductase [Ignavibacteriales bacterium]MBL1123619.1 SDR family oxidoreductase [Ignavibacteriota bacterium]MCC7093930.1 SDR family oxidoreductase [Ignavibacteriaceae bacterium]MCE7855524.1 SDR family oxidoreductase [Ignavibacteria bacterium CHB3]MEB2297037.1 SDR family oxidoreductase [Ignavibacteria bacterium]